MQITDCIPETKTEGKITTTDQIPCLKETKVSLLEKKTYTYRPKNQYQGQGYKITSKRRQQPPERATC